MTMKITEEQSAKVNRLIQCLCCNYDDEYCLLLDDGEPCRCIQEMSCYGIYCNYFRCAVLLADQKLYEEIVNQNKLYMR